MNCKYPGNNSLKTAVCTITSASHWFKVNALFESLKSNGCTELHCLITDQLYAPEQAGIITHSLNDLNDDLSQAIIRKYTGNQLRWSCKPLFLKKLLESGYEKVIYVDNDIAFFGSPEPLFEKLNDKSILLTPHFYPADPTKDQIWMEANFRVGLYNGGFIGVNHSAIPAMEWWAEACLYNVKKAYRRGLFDDQKYLDLMPVLYDGTEILKHKGCNVAGWNILTSPRSIDKNGVVTLNGQWPLVFVHFNYYTIDCILKGKDPCLEMPWQQYLKWVRLQNADYDPAKEQNSFNRNFYQYLDYLKYKIVRMFE